jgi:DNA adenine methylase
MSTVKSAIKYHGAKSYLAKRIVALMPPHLAYVEPYFGGGSVLFEKDAEGISEVVNDLDGQLTNFWRVLQQDRLFEIFLREIQATPFSEAEWNGANENFNDDEFIESEPVACAINFFIRCRQSLAGRMKAFTPLSRTRVRRGMNEQTSAWLTAIEGLPAVHERLKRVVILNRDALDVIRQQDGAETLFYLDPSYLPETRIAKKVYEHEMTVAQHEELLSLLCSLKGYFMLSGYRSTLYDDIAEANGWHRHDFEIANHASGGATKRKMVESLWSNF